MIQARIMAASLHNLAAAEYEFHVGDTLEVSGEDYDAKKAVSVVNAKMKLESVRDRYFTCSFAEHRVTGQRVSIRVDGSSMSMIPATSLQPLLCPVSVASPRELSTLMF